MLRPGHALMLLMTSLLAIGVVTVHSAGVDLGSSQSFQFTDLLSTRVTIMALLACATAWLASHAPIELLSDETVGRRIAFILFTASMVLLLLVHMPGIGREVNGARRWLTLGGLGFQPSEIAKWSMVIIMAWYVANRAETLQRYRTGFLPGLAISVMLILPIVTEDLGTAVLMGAVAVCMLVAAGSRVLHAASLLPLAVLGFVAAVLASSYRIDRIRAFLDPYADPGDTGYHILQSMASISGGGLAGRGLGNSVQKFGYLPEDTTDFIFSVISEELGIVGVLMVVGLLIGILAVGLRIARRATSIYHKVLVLGIMLTFGMQALINLLVVTGLAPTKGIALPLVSWGGTGWLMTSACLGLVWAVDRRNTLRSVDRSAPEIVPVGSE